jgi:hypothetical protein
MKTTCISHPANERLVIIRKWQVEFCAGNQCAAALLSFFEYWHSWKLESDRYNHKSNNISEHHGETRSLSENVYQYHSLSEMSDGILNLYGAKAIAEAIKLLEAKNVISVHANPNPRFHYDKTKYFVFYPEVCNDWIKSSYKSTSGENATSIEQKDVCDVVKTPNALSENTSPSRKKALPITEINNKEINQSIKAISENENDGNSKHTHTDLTRMIVEALIAKGMSTSKFYDDSLTAIKRLQEAGATVTQFIEGYDQSVVATKGGGFGVNYLIKAVETILICTKTSTNQILSIGQASEVGEGVYQPDNKPIFENDFRYAEGWASDLI